MGKTFFLSLRIWFLTNVMLASCSMITLPAERNPLFVLVLVGVVGGIVSVPAVPVIYFSMLTITRKHISRNERWILFLMMMLALCCAYSILGDILFVSDYERSVQQYPFYLQAMAYLSVASLLAILLNSAALNNLFSGQRVALFKIESFISRNVITIKNIFLTIILPGYKIKTTMEQNEPSMNVNDNNSSTTESNKILIKALITAGLILAMLIPTVFITNLVKEREERNKEVVAEVSNKWATPQVVNGPYLVVPYKDSYINNDKKVVNIIRQVVLLPENEAVSATLQAEERKRSIYKVLLYRSVITSSGTFSIKLPRGVDAANLVFEETKLCIGVSDFKGIEEKVTVNFNGTNYDLTPGLPDTKLSNKGLSSFVNFTAADITKPVAFDYKLKLKGSEQLQFLPLSGNSKFTLRSAWPNPSFNGNSLPAERSVSQKGFDATWFFNKANLPFNTVLIDPKMEMDAFAFGVSMVQPADQYAKTMRSVKYAILFIGLTFSLFFIIELLQKKPVHPVQYILVGLALVIFYTLLLSISEFLLFNAAYFIAAAATVTLITLYAKSHFEKWNVALVFGLVLSGLYGFIYVLIQLEDTALLVGSIGLFVVLAFVMYASRKVNWYRPSFGKPGTVAGI